MSEEILIRQGAPTLAGIKTGSLFPCPCENCEDLLADIRRLNRRLSPKGLCLLPIRFLAGQALLYLYRRAELRRDLRDARVSELLRQAGYEDESCALCGAACLPLPRERRVSARGGAVSQLSARGRQGLHRPPRERLQVRGAVEGLRRRGQGTGPVRKIQKMHGDLLRTLAKRLEARAACRRGLII